MGLWRRYVQLEIREAFRARKPIIAIFEVSAAAPCYMVMHGERDGL
jgi:hypothetical protein